MEWKCCAEIHKDICFDCHLEEVVSNEVPNPRREHEPSGKSKKR